MESKIIEYKKVIVWPCGTECEPEELFEMLQFMSDDFEVRRVPLTAEDNS